MDSGIGIFLFLDYGSSGIFSKNFFKIKLLWLDFLFGVFLVWFLFFIKVFCCVYILEWEVLGIEELLVSGWYFSMLVFFVLLFVVLGYWGYEICFDDFCEDLGFIFFV